MPLSPLTQWSQGHVRNIFESRYDAEAMLAIDQTFATSMRGTINGKDMSYKDVKHLVQAIRNTSSSRSLKIEWQKFVEFPADEQNRGGVVEGSYIIHGIFKQLPGSDRPVQFTRHKIVKIRIESSPDDTKTDCRRIVELNFTGSDNPVADRANYRISLFFLFFLCIIGVALYYFQSAGVFPGILLDLKGSSEWSALPEAARGMLKRLSP